MQVLVVEDEKKTAAFIGKGLEEAGFSVEIAGDGETALERAMAAQFDIAIVDVMLPTRDGWSVVKELRAAGWSKPIIFLTARDSVQERVRGLELGADDYLVKPFAFPELLARLRTLLRRAPAGADEPLHVADLEVDIHRNRATRRGVALNLTQKEFLLLAYLARSPGVVVSRADIVKHVWGVDFQTETNVVDVVVRRLRAKVDDPFPTKLIHTIRGVGYVIRPG